MTSNTRLKLCAVIIVLSAAYAVVVAKSPQVASAIAAGYTAVLITVLLALNVWKRP